MDYDKVIPQFPPIHSVSPRLKAHRLSLSPKETNRNVALMWTGRGKGPGGMRKWEWTEGTGQKLPAIRKGKKQKLQVDGKQVQTSYARNLRKTYMARTMERTSVISHHRAQSQIAESASASPTPTGQRKNCLTMVNISLPIVFESDGNSDIASQGISFDSTLRPLRVSPPRQSIKLITFPLL